MPVYVKGVQNIIKCFFKPICSLSSLNHTFVYISTRIFVPHLCQLVVIHFNLFHLRFFVILRLQIYLNCFAFEAKGKKGRRNLFSPLALLTPFKRSFISTLALFISFVSVARLATLRGEHLGELITTQLCPYSSLSFLLQFKLHMSHSVSCRLGCNCRFSRKFTCNGKRFGSSYRNARHTGQPVNLGLSVALLVLNSNLLPQSRLENLIRFIISRRVILFLKLFHKGESCVFVANLVNSVLIWIKVSKLVRCALLLPNALRFRANDRIDQMVLFEFAPANPALV